MPGPATAPTLDPSAATALFAAFQPFPLEDLARDSGFLRRRPKKVSPGAFLQLCCLLALQTQASLRAWACLWGLLTGETLSKQGLAKRCSSRAVAFVRTVLELLLARLCTAPTQVPAALRSFGRVILQDSTNLALPPKLATHFPGSRNQSQKATAALKLQVFYDLLSQRCLHFWLTPFTTNDQKASGLILRLARRGDLIIRDLGYLVLGVLSQAEAKGVFFLSRWRHGIAVYDPEQSQAIDLLQRLRREGAWDAPILLGAQERLPARLIALPLPAPVAAERRRKALANRDRRLRPSKERLALLGWEIFLTNVPATVWSVRQVAETYRLRWRIEILFKAWKSHFHLGHFTQGSAAQVELLVYGRLLWIALFKASFLPPSAAAHPLSTLKLAAFCQDYFLPLLLQLAAPLNPAALWDLISYHCRVEKRRKRRPQPLTDSTPLS